MRKLGPLIVAAIAFLAFEPAFAEPSEYLCITEQVAGVHFSGQTRSWVPQVYAPGRKFIFRRLNGDERVGKYRDTNPQGYTFNRAQEIEKDKSEWGFFPFGEMMPWATCDASFRCTTTPTSMLFVHFEPRSGRFEYTSLSGYTYQPIMEQPGSMGADPASEKIRQAAVAQPDDGALAIGKCSAF